MSSVETGESGRDLSLGVPLSELADGEPLFGQVEDEPVYVLRSGEEIKAYGASCTHYGAPLSDGLLHGGLLRCPWHHARFSVTDGDVQGGPALNPLPPYEVEVRDGKAIVGRRLERDPLARVRDVPADFGPESVVIVGAGPAGAAAAETLRREGYRKPVTLVDSDPDAPYDRPNLSKAYLAGDAPAEWLSLRDADFYREHDIQRLEDRVVNIETERRRVELASGDVIEYGSLLLAPGSVARQLDVAGADLPHVHTLRSLADCEDIIEAADDSETAVIIGASFIGMEVAASLTTRGVGVTVVAPEEVPFARTLGPSLGSALRSLHEENGVSFRLGRGVSAVLEDAVRLDNGVSIAADMVVMGVGVDPDVRLALEAGLDVDDGILVDEQLRTSEPHVFAAGDVARYPDPRSDRRVRIEHWVVAGRQGRTAARNILGAGEPFTDPPFFWTRQFGTSVAYVGHGADWDRTEADGDCAAGDCAVTFVRGDRSVALATVGRSDRSLRAEIEWEEEVTGS